MLRLVAVLVLVLAGACGPGRTAPATQPSPAAFDAQKSEPKAVEIADQVIAACGGEAAWAKARQLSWDQKLQVDDKSLEFHHDWDRWNGRHRGTLDMGGHEMVVGYEIFGDQKWAMQDDDQVSSKDVPKLVEVARKRLAIDAYTLFMPFKLKDPGVILKYAGERPPEGGPADAAAVFDVIKVTFEAGVDPQPGNTYYVVVSKESHLIDHVEMVEEGKPDDQRLGYRFEEWTESGGLKLSLKRTNIGHPGEVWQFANVKVSESPEEDLYTPVIK